MDSNILKKKGFGLFEVVIVLAIFVTIITAAAVSFGKQRQVSQALRTLSELNTIVTACTQYYNDNGAWPVNLAALRPKYLSPQSNDNNVFESPYIINGGADQVTVTTTIPTGLATNKSFGSEIIIATSGSNDIISVTKPVTTGNWRLKYDKKYLYSQ